ncbi:hypothetical protein K1719_033675 [Acacia pycnantha]|nr:hypothetical protein K1719_033675 [Acacia pycnantha]
MDKSCTLFVHFDKGTPAIANEIKEALKGNDVEAKVDALKKAIMLLLNGETIPQLFINFSFSIWRSLRKLIRGVWAYVKLHNLQNPVNRREIKCDEKLKSLFEGKENVGFLEVGKLLSRHFQKN